MAGKSAKLKEFKDDLKGNIIDINEDDMKVSINLLNNLQPHFHCQGNPIDWMTKAMTQEQAPRPSGKGPKVNRASAGILSSMVLVLLLQGLAKSRHQITYLAHQAKER